MNAFKISSISFFLVLITIFGTVFAQGDPETCEDICSDPQLTITYDECIALTSLYIANGGESRVNKTNRTTSADVATRRGVVLTTGDGERHVQELILPANNLVGDLTASLSVLTSLLRLDLQNNALTSLPASLEALSQLQELIVTQNQLTSLPNIFTNRGSLDLLRADQNQLTSLPESIGNLYELDLLDLSNNALTSLPLSIGSLDDLDILKVAYNQLTVLPNPISDLDQLSLLDAQGNMLTVWPAQVEQLITLESLQVQDNKFTTVPATVFSLPSLHHLNLRNNLIAELPTGRQGSASLQIVDLGSNRLTTLPDSLSTLDGLTQLYLHENRLTSFPGQFFTLPTLQLLSLAFNRLIGTLPDSFTQLQNLTYLDISYNALDHTQDGNVLIPASLETWISRSGFTLQGGGQYTTAGERLVFTDQEPFPAIATTTVIRTVELTPGVRMSLDNEQQPTILVSGTNPICTQLQVRMTLNASGTYELQLQPQKAGVYEGCTLQLVDQWGELTTPREIPTLTIVTESQAVFCDNPEVTIEQSACLALLHLFMATDGVNRTRPDGWFVHPRVEEWYGIETAPGTTKKKITGLYLHSNDRTPGKSPVTGKGNGLHGVLPNIFTDLPDLVNLSLGNNTLSGPLPLSLGTLTNLKFFYLQNNAFTGPLDAIVSGLGSLRRMSVQKNKLSGGLADAFVGLLMLEAVDIRDNSFSGLLPSFSTQAPIWYLHAANNKFAGPLSSSRATYASWQHLYLQGNVLEGMIPENRSSWSGLQYINISANALTRDVNKEALLGAGLVNRRQSRMQKNRANQKDTIAPVVTKEGSRSVSGTTYQLIIGIQENNYAIDALGVGMPAVIGGNVSCKGLVASDLRVATGTTLLTVTPDHAGIYENCTLTILDHGKNYSNTIDLPLLGHDLGEQSICLNANLSISLEECRALRDFYEATDGENRTNRNNWWQTPDVDSWFGVQTALKDGKEHVTQLLLHRNELTSVNDPVVPQAQGNNLQGTLPDSLSDLAYLTHFRGDDNHLTGSPRDALVGMNDLEMITLANNSLSGLLPVHWGGFAKLTVLDLRNNQFTGSFPVSRKVLHSLAILRLGKNMLGGLVEVASGDRGALEEVDLSANQFSGSLDADRSFQHNLITFNLSNNRFAGFLPPARSSLTGVEILDVSENTLSGPFPVAYQSLLALREFSASGNTLYGDINTVFPLRSSLEKLNITANKFTGRIGNQRAMRTGITDFLVAKNHLDRTVTHDAILGSGIVSWYTSRTRASLEEQVDSAAPKLTSPTIIRSPVTNVQKILLTREENSYPVNEGGSGMSLTLAGGGACSSVHIDTGTLSTHTGTISLLLQPQQSGVYTCWITVTDHAGNEGRLQITPFLYDATCGDGQIVSPEQCDEGRFCDQVPNTECTQDDALCPFSCVTQMVDNCTPACKQSICGDRFVDGNGLDNIAGTQDDELCDIGSFCTDGRDCTANPSICPGGAAGCQTRFTSSCSPVCAPSNCGDGILDDAGINDLLDDEDDEDCDDENTISGDGCSSSCKVEYCGDGFVDANGIDQQAGTEDDEACDLGPGNGLRAGQCNQFCKVNEQTCQRCFETCQGGTGHHSIYLLIDVSGSMEGNKMEKAKQGAIDFVHHIMSGAALNTGFVSKIGLIKFSSNGTVVSEPSTNYTQLVNSIQALQAGGSTNFGDPLYDAKNYFDTHDTGYEKHIVLLSDGLPTVGTSNMSAEDYSKTAAAEVKASGIRIYTIAVEQTETGIEFMRNISSAAFINLASGKSATQSSTSSSRSASRAVDADKDNYSKTNSNSTAWWQVDLGVQRQVREIKIWNRSNLGNQTSNYYVFASANPFTSTNLTTTRTQSGVVSFYETGTVQRPTTITLDNSIRYVRVQLVGNNKLQLAEVEVFGCNGIENCDRIFSFEDYTSEIIGTLYGHIFGSIHCGCGPYQVCGICGDGVVDPTYGEKCDEGSSCNDGRNCSTDASICPSECRPRTSQTCTNLCQLPSCGDGVIQTGKNEQCDDGNQRVGDGCSPSCTTEKCGDSILDLNGPDQVLGTSDDEQCDDSNTESGDGCTASCKAEFCGDGSVLGDELCDTGRSCDDGTSCTTNPWICPGQCQTRFTGGCAPDCSFGYCGDLIVDTDGANNSNDDGDDEQCDPGKFCPNGIPCSHDASLCPGSCEVTFTPTCTQHCKTTYCGDGFVDLDGVDENMETTYDNEQCDDGNGVNGDGCSSLCLLEDETGCGGLDCSQICGDGTKQFFEPCDPTDTTDEMSAFCTDICTISVCGDGILFAGEECDGGTRCDDLSTVCTSDPTVCPTGPSECKPRYKNGCTESCQRGCGDGLIQEDGIDRTPGTSDDEQCDDGNARQTDSCTNVCKAPICGDGIITYYAQIPTTTGTVLYYETCDDGNTYDGDDCPANCIGSGVAMTGLCSTSIQPFAFYDMYNISFDDITQFCEVGIPDGSPIYNSVLKQREWLCHGILGGADTSCTLGSWSCGDGVVDIWQDAQTGRSVEEACDDGNMDNGDGCNAVCQFEQPIYFGPENTCASTVYPTIQPGEVIPFWWEGIIESEMHSGACDTATTNTLIHPEEILCSFTLSRGNPDGFTEQVGGFQSPCMTDFSAMTGGLLIRDALIDQGQDPETILGGTYGSSESGEQRLRDASNGSYTYGQYRLDLTSVTFPYCAHTRVNSPGSTEVTITRQTVERTYTSSSLCSNKLTVLPGYLMQQKVLFSEQPNTGLDLTITSISGTQLYVTDSSYDQGDLLVQYSGPEKSYLFDQIVEKYHPLATEIYMISTANDSATTFKKVPNSNVYIYTESHDLLLERSQIEYLLLQGGVSSMSTLETPFTIILPDNHAELQLIGNIPGRGMYVARGDVSFVAQNCDTNDAVQGLFVTNGQFTTTATVNTDISASSRCKRGSLRVEGLLLGGDISATLANVRRGTLNLRENEKQWYTSEENISHLADQLYRTCYEVPLLYDAVNKLVGTTNTPYGGPFAGCSQSNAVSFQEIKTTATRKLLDSLFGGGNFFNKAFSEQNTLIATTFLKLLPTSMGASGSVGSTTSLITTFLYKDTVYTVQIPSWKMQQIMTAGKRLPSFRGVSVDLNDMKVREQFIEGLSGLIGPVYERITHLDHPLGIGKSGVLSLHRLLEQQRGSAYTEDILQQIGTNESGCTTSFTGVDGHLYENQHDCLLTHTPLYKWMIEQTGIYTTQKAEKDVQMLEGAGVQVRSAPFLRQNPPPGSRDLLQAMKISF